jgi:hypothetical protein
LTTNYLQKKIIFDHQLSAKKDDNIFDTSLNRARRGKGSAFLGIWLPDNIVLHWHM